MWRGTLPIPVEQPVLVLLAQSSRPTPTHHTPVYVADLDLLPAPRRIPGHLGRHAAVVPLHREEAVVGVPVDADAVDRLGVFDSCRFGKEEGAGSGGTREGRVKEGRRSCEGFFSLPTPATHSRACALPRHGSSGASVAAVSWSLRRAAMQQVRKRSIHSACLPGRPRIPHPAHATHQAGLPAPPPSPRRSCRR